MGIILAGILIGVLIVVVLCLLAIENEIIGSLVLVVAFICVIAGFYVGIAVPVSGYADPQILDTTELVSLRDGTISEGTGGLFYVSISGTNSYTYYVEVDSAYASNSQKAYKSNTLYGSNITIVEDSSFTDAKLVTYVMYGKKTFWTFSAGAKEYEFVFYVPEGTVSRDISLG